MKTKLFFIAALVWVSLGYTQTLNVSKLDSIITTLEKNNRAQFSVSLAEKGQVIYQRSVGYVDTNLTIPVNENTKYRIGSITKMFTSVMILQLVDEKKLTLQTPLSKFFPKIKNAKLVTIEQLLAHQSGIHNFTNDSTYLDYYTSPKSQKEMLDMIAASPSDFDPGTKQAYSNANFVLLGYIIEKITKKAYSENLQIRIVQKAGLKNTYYGSKADPGKNECRSFYWRNDRWKADKETDMSIPHGAGAIVSTTNDLAKFIHALFGGKLISTTSLTDMATLRKRMGLGLFSIPFEEKNGYGHNGGIDEFGSQLVYFPEDSFSIAITCNGSRYSMNDFMGGALCSYYNRPYDIPVFSNYTVAENILEQYIGKYHSAMLKMDMDVTRDGTTLIVKATDQNAVSLEAMSDTQFNMYEAGAIFEFKKNELGVVNVVVLKQGGMEFNFDRQ